MQHLQEHLAGTNTYGHYLLDKDSKCRLFAFDIDLEKTGSYVTLPNWEELDPNISDAEVDKLTVITEGVNPRELWLDRRAADARRWYKYQMKALAYKLVSACSEIGIGSAAAYSGAKGVHVYGFTGEMPAAEAREGAQMVLDLVDEFELYKGRNFYKHKNPDPFHGYQNFSIEVFPKQDSLKSKDLGNLMRLPLGRNQKTNDPTFFLDMVTPLGMMVPHTDPVKLLESGDPFA